MKQDTKKDGGWLLKFMVVFAGIALAGIFLRSCYKVITLDIEFNPAQYYETLRIHASPKKLVYVAGVDTELDLTGGKICYSYERKNEGADLCDGTGCNEVVDMEEALETDRWLFMDADIDFATPGTYDVVFRSVEDAARGEIVISCSFPIVVIDPEDAVN